MWKYTVESFTVESSDGVKVRTRVFKPEGDVKDDNLAIVLVHPYSLMGGSQGLLKGIASGLSQNGYTAVTFDMRGVGRSTGRSSLTGFAEVKDVVAVSNWVSHTLSLHRILLIGSSAALSTMSNYTLESFTVESSDGVMVHTRVFQPEGEVKDSNLAIVLVHPYSLMGGLQGLLKGIASGLAQNGYTAVTFDMRGVGRSTGRPSLTGFAEVKDVVAVSSWVSHTLSHHRILLVGSSAGAPIAGSAVDQIEQVIGYVSIGYPFGMTASILFGRHHKAILQSPKPKLFIMGTRDGFTSVKQLKNKLSSAAGRVETHLIDGVGHFQMEGPAYDAHMVDLIIEFIASL